MSAASPAEAPTEADGGLPLPPIERGVLDVYALRALAAAIDATAEAAARAAGGAAVLEVIVKAAPDAYAEAVPATGAGRAAKAVELLVAGLLRGVQLRYTLGDDVVIDTLRPEAAGFAIVRLRTPAAG